MRLKFEKDGRGILARVWNANYTEVAYARIGIEGLQAEIEFPNDWHENARAWVRVSLGFFKVAFSFPSARRGEDDHQCQGATYGFQFYSDMLLIKYGQPTGTRNSPSKAFWMPWAWKHREHLILSEPETHPYRYTLKSGEVQDVQATIQKESRRWTRFWIPCQKTRTTIDVRFSGEVGERAGSWKGGTIGCGHEMKKGETPLETLRRMEKERSF